MAILGDKLVDKRIVERNISKGLLSKEQHQQYLSDLADKETNSELVEVETPDAPDGEPQR